METKHYMWTLEEWKNPNINNTEEIQKLIGKMLIIRSNKDIRSLAGLYEVYKEWYSANYSKLGQALK